MIVVSPLRTLLNTVMNPTLSVADLQRKIAWPTLVNPNFVDYRPPTKYDGRLCFYTCVSVHMGEGVAQGLWSQALPWSLGPGPFQKSTPMVL